MSEFERKQSRQVDDESAKARGNVSGRRGVGTSPSGSGQGTLLEMPAVETTGAWAQRIGDGAWDFDDRLRGALGLDHRTPATRTPEGPVRSIDVSTATKHAGPRDGAGAAGLASTSAPGDGDGAAVQMRAAGPRRNDGAWEFGDSLRSALGLDDRRSPAHVSHERAGSTSPIADRESIQMRAATGLNRAGDPAGLHETAAAGLRGLGRSLPHLDRIQASFGKHDVTTVSAHTGPDAAVANKAMGAEAYATGNAVAFASPSPSLHIAAHEAAHVVQQRGCVQLKGGVGDAGDAYERHADAVADQVVQGKSAEALLDHMAGPMARSHSTSPTIQRKAIEGGGAPELEYPRPPVSELLEATDEPAPPAPEHPPAIASSARVAARPVPTAEGHPESGAVPGAHAAARSGSLSPDDHGAEPSAPSDTHGAPGVEVGHGHVNPVRHGAESSAPSDTHSAPGAEAGHRHVNPAGPDFEQAARPDSSTGESAAQGGRADRRPQDHRAESTQGAHGVSAVRTAQAPATGASLTEDTPRDVQVGPEDHATVVSVRTQSTAPSRPAPIPVLAPGGIAEYVRRSAERRGDIAPAPVRASAPAAAPAAPGPGAPEEVAVRDAAAPAGVLPSIATAAPAAPQPIRFQAEPEAEREPDHAASEAQANAFASAAQQRMAALRNHVDTSARALEPRLAAADQAIDAAKARSQAGIRAAMAHLRADAEARVAGATAEITDQHVRTVATARTLSSTQKASLDAAARAAVASISQGEAQCVPALDAAYAAGDHQFRRSGEQVGREALAVGADYRARWMAQRNGESTIMSGPVHDNRLEARAKAADQVAKVFHDQLLDAANQQADAAQQGKSRDREALAAAASAQRDTVIGTLRDAHAGIDHAEAAAIEAADGQRDTDLKLLAAQHASTVKTISRKEAALLEEIGAHAAGHKKALRTYVQAAVARCSNATNELVATHDASMASFHTQAAATPAPAEPELALGLRQQHAAVQHAADASEAKFSEVFAGAEQQIAATERDSVQGVAGFAVNTHQVTAQISGSIAHNLAGFVQHSKTAFAGIEQQYGHTADAIIAAAYKTNHEAAASSTSIFSRMTDGLATGFASSANGLEANLRAALLEGDQSIHPQIQKSADDAARQVQPRWKKVLKVLVTVAVIVTVAVVAGPAVIGAVGAIAGGLGAGAAAGTIGVIVGGAAVGAASGAAIQISNNVIDANKWHQGVGTAAAMGAISGVFGGVGGLAAKGLTSLGIRTLVTLGFDGAGSVVGNIATGQPLTFEGIAVGLAIGLGMSVGMGALGRFGGKVGAKVEDFQVRAGDAGAAAGKRAVGVVKGSESLARSTNSQNPRRPAGKDWDAEAALKVQKLLDRPMRRAARAELEIRWQRIQKAVERLRVEQGTADPAAVARARAEVDGFRQASSSTVHSNAAEPEATLASKNWQQADQMVRGWAASGEPLTLSRIQEINFTLQQGLRRQGTPGELRTASAAAGGQISRMYVSPKELESRMAAFLDWYNSNAPKMSPIELAASAYQRLISIHPFGDANGRTCRLVMDWILERHGLPPATFSGDEHSLAVYWSDVYNGQGVTTEQAVAAVTKAVERTIELTTRATQQGLQSP